MLFVLHQFAESNEPFLNDGKPSSAALLNTLLKPATENKDAPSEKKAGSPCHNLLSNPRLRHHSVNEPLMVYGHRLTLSLMVRISINQSGREGLRSKEAYCLSLVNKDFMYPED
jgi:hypothetical protein